MKTKEEMQAIVNEIREVCKLHGIVLMPGPDGDNGGYEIILVEAEDIVTQDPHCIYFNGDLKPENLQLTNKVIDYLNRNEDGSKAMDRFTIKGIGDVHGHTKTRIVVSQYAPDRETNFVRNAMMVDVESLDEVKDVIFVKPFTDEPGFVRLGIDLTHGPFGVLQAFFTNHQPLVVGFIEGPSHEDMAKQWPEPQEESNGDH